jgi:hypothetical protein
MRMSRRLKAPTVVIATVGLMVAMPSQASAAPKKFTAQGLSPSSSIIADKSPSGRLAQNDTALLNRTDSKPVHR